ncbi:MAG: hypothetical protein OXG59_15600, partial [Gammaproteobacteria bacterium]|nr:hypothetical protein [Gammaproteobacteria bacterium]
LNEKRAVLSQIEDVFKVSVVLVANSAMETPEFELRRVRGKDDDDDTPSYEMATVTAPPPALLTPSSPKAPEKPAVERTLPDTAPPERKAKAARKQKGKKKPKAGFFARLFGLDRKKRKKADAGKKRQKAHPPKRTRSRHPSKGKGGGRGRKKGDSRAKGGQRQKADSRPKGQQKQKRGDGKAKAQPTPAAAKKDGEAAGGQAPRRRRRRRRRRPAADAQPPS